MYFWIKTFHIAAMLVWFSGLVFLPRLFLARARRERDARGDFFRPMSSALYLYVATPAAAVTIALGMVLIGYGPTGAWLVLKLALVLLVVLMHLYFGVLLYDLRQGKERHGPGFFRAIGWLPFLVLLAIAALTGAKPETAAGLPAPPGSSSPS